MRTAVVLTILLIGSPSATAQINNPTPPVMSSSAPGASKGDAGRPFAPVPTSTGVTGAAAPPPPDVTIVPPDGRRTW